MEPLTSPVQVRNLLDQAAEEIQDTKRRKLINQIVINETTIFEHGLKYKEIFLSQVWQLAKLDKSGRMAALARSLNLQISAPPLQPEKFLYMAIQVLANRLPRLTKGLNMVSILIYLNIISVLNIVTKAETTLKAKKIGNILKISSHLPQAELRETTEIYQLSSLKIFEHELSQSLEDLKNLKKFKPSAKPCSNIEKTDDILEMLALAESQKYTSLRMNHFEPNGQQNFVTALFKIRNKYQCFMSYSPQRAKELLASSHFRTEPTSQIELARYRKYADEVFRTASNKSCLRHGGLNNMKLYGRQISVTEPGLERCSQICAHQASTHIFSTQLAKLTEDIEILPICHGFTYLPVNKTCYVSRKMTEAHFISHLSFKDDWRAALTGEPHCVKNREQAFLKLNTSLVSTSHICQFSHRDFTNSKLQTRCTAKYYSYSRPLLNIKEQIKYFKTQVLKLYEVKSKHKFKRAITLPGALTETVLSFLSNLALRTGTSLINNFVNGLGLKTIDMLDKSLKKLEQAGFKSELITNMPKQDNFTLFNYTLVSKAFTSLQMLSNLDKDINFDKVLFDLSEQYNKLKKYYIALLTKPQPLLNMTRKALKDKNYVFSSYIKDDQIFRHFFWSEMSNSETAKFISTVPLKTKDFMTKQFYQSGIFKRNEKNKANECLIQIMQNKNISSHCAPSIEIYQNKIITMNHIVEFENITILIMRGQNFVEIYCQKDTQVFFTKNLRVMAIPKNCKLVINEKIFQIGTHQKSNFVIKTLYEERWIKTEETTHKLNLIIISVTIFICLGIGGLATLGYICYKRYLRPQGVSSTYFQVTEQLPEITEMLKPVEKVERMPRQMTKL